MGSNAHSRSVYAGGGTVSGAFSALHLLRSCSLLAPPSADLRQYEALSRCNYGFGEAQLPLRANPSRETSLPSSLTAALSLPSTLLPPPLLAAVSTPSLQSINIPRPISNSATAGALTSNHFMGSNGISAVHHRRPRGEKKPIPDDQKDEKYYERRKRNNQAAKKSRDARKIREDHIALRATMLEHENAILRAQVMTLREEAQSLRRMLIRQQTSQQR